VRVLFLFACLKISNNDTLTASIQEVVSLWISSENDCLSTGGVGKSSVDVFCFLLVVGFVSSEFRFPMQEGKQNKKKKKTTSHLPTLADMRFFGCVAEK
jgi:hypothetical protein